MSHWYSWFPGDYLRDTQHLSMLEDAAYRRMLDAYYMSGKLSANAEVLLRVCRAVTQDEQAAVRTVAEEFFERHGDQLFHSKVEHCIAQSRAVSAKRSDAGKKGAAKTNALKAAIAAANDITSATALASSIPQPQVNLPTTSGAFAPKEVDSIFGHGVDFLKAKGSSEKSARSFLGQMRKGNSDDLVAEAIAKAESSDVSDPISWIRRYLDRSIGSRPARTEKLVEIEYGSGGLL